MRFFTLPVDHAPVQYSRHRAPLFVVQLQSDPLSGQTPQSMRRNQQQLKLKTCVCAHRGGLAYHWLGRALFELYFFHPAQLRAVHASRTNTGVNVSPLILVGLHSCLFKDKKDAMFFITPKWHQHSSKQNTVIHFWIVVHVNGSLTVTEAEAFC